MNEKKKEKTKPCMIDEVEVAMRHLVKKTARSL